jgi:hypothetical protein
LNTLFKYGMALVFIGVLFLFASAFAETYQTTQERTVTILGQTYDLGTYTTTPYKEYVPSLQMCAIAFFVLGFAVIVVGFSEKREKGLDTPIHENRQNLKFS